jgi:hypothetical protein
MMDGHGRPLLGPRDPDTEGPRAWNGVFPSAGQLVIFARWMATPVHSASYGHRYNAWRIATNREPLDAESIRYVQSMFSASLADLWPALRKLARRGR